MPGAAANNWSEDVWWRSLWARSIGPAVVLHAKSNHAEIMSEKRLPSLSE